MAFEHKVKVIVKLTMDIENGKDKCYPYLDTNETYPNGLQVIKNETTDLYQISSDEESELRQKIVAHTFTLSQGEEEHSVTVLRYENLPDFGCPDLPLFEKLLDKADGLKEDRPIAVHCAAGLGRSGLLVEMYKIRALLEKAQKAAETPIDIVEDIKQLRSIRTGMVQSIEQLKFLYTYTYALYKADLKGLENTVEELSTD